ncbi:MAG TPA: F0F1 ATP synthase subunit delta [Accumulibacter sp.]|uniref:F0F1 ATP synthase subunit B family protein n=1 Tax=Accumulibacter sp. TaxID=2053492 RepID=UPI002C00A710|nr:F0F1 ATP synthase subunit B [Accumulibacter sp.]HRD88636.1 F0F1 ATP synthase subunit delta [Accumulibacter sp.]
MLIDWFTVGAQALNFLILVWLMKRFLYQPILHAIDAREKRIAAKLGDAAKKEAEAKNERDTFLHKNDEFDQQRAALLTKATEEAKTERQRLFDEARKAADSLSAKRHETLLSDARNLSKAISRKTQDEVFAIARKALSDLAGASLEERMGDIFIDRLRAVSDEAKAAFAKALKTDSEQASLRSAFDLAEGQQAKIQKAINETFLADIHVRFETAPDLVSGVELDAGGQKIAWTIADYLAALEQSVGELLQEKDQPEVKPEVKAKPAPKRSKPAPRPQ